MAAMAVFSAFSSASLFLLPFIFLFPLLPQSHAQQAYVDNKQLACERNDTVTLGYVCNGAATACTSYLTFRSTPIYNNPVTIAYLLAADASQIAAINNISDVGSIPDDTLLIIPINCSCSGGNYYQHNASYVLKETGETYFSVANNTYQALSTCQSIEAQNRFNELRLFVNDRLTVPLRCACPTPNQTTAGFRYLLTYLIRKGNDIPYIADTFSGAGADDASIRDANELSDSKIIFFFTPILVPLKTEPTKENMNTAVLQPPPPPPPAPSITRTSDSDGNSRKWVFVGVGVGVAVILLASVFLFWFFRRQVKRRENSPAPPPKLANESGGNKGTWSWSVSSEGIRSAVETLKIYKFEELEKATNSFSEANRIGNSSVYRGSFKGDDAAVKIMKGNVSPEIDLLRQINHFHIIRLSGFCLYEGITYLVYEYAINGSLCNWLQRKGNSVVKNYNSSSGEDYLRLDWKQRVQIAHDVADALNYLHNFTNPPYIHKDLNSSNILLDGNLRAKIINFGFAKKLDDTNDQPVMTRHVVGTYGYMAPEYVENGLVTPKLDVFALGVVILELMSGREPVTNAAVSGKGDQILLSESIGEVLGGENVRDKLREFIDPRLGQEYPRDLAYSMVQLAKNCVAHDLNDRPTVPQVLMILSKILSSSLDWDPSHDLQNSTSLSHDSGDLNW